MKIQVTCLLLVSMVSLSYAQQKNQHFNDTTFLQPVEITAVRAAEKAPFAKTNLSKKELEKNDRNS